MRRIAFLALIVLFSGMVPLAMAVAQAIDINKINKISRYNAMTEEEFNSKTKIFTEVPRGDRYLEYSIRLRDGWQKLGLDEEERESIVENSARQLESDPHDISNLRDQKLLEEKNNVTQVEENFKSVHLDEQGTMISKRNREDFEKSLKRGDSASLLGPIAKYVGPPSILAPARLEIYAVQLKHDITTRNWFLNYIISRNFTLQGMEQVNESRVDAEYVFLEDGIAYVVRTAAISNGSRMILVSYYVPEKFWEKEKGFQEMSIDSFKFIQPAGSILDDKRTHGFLDLVKFSYPGSWKLIAPSVTSVDNMTAKLIYSMDEHILQGEIDINLISTELDTNLMKEVEYLRQDLKEKGLEIGETLDTNGDFKFSDKINFSRVEAYAVAGEKKEFIDYEYWLGIMVEDRYYYIVTMLTPGRKADFYTWARNTEAFGTVIQTLGPQTARDTLDATFLQKMQGSDSGSAPVIVP